MEELAMMLADGRAEIVNTGYISSPELSEEDEDLSESSCSYDSETENFADNPLASVEKKKTVPCYKFQNAYIIVECWYENGIIMEIDSRIYDNDCEMYDYCLAMINYYGITYHHNDNIDELINKLLLFAYDKNNCERKFHNTKIIKSIVKGQDVKIYQKCPNF